MLLAPSEEIRGLDDAHVLRRWGSSRSSFGSRWKGRNMSCKQMGHARVRCKHDGINSRLAVTCIMHLAHLKSGLGQLKAASSKQGSQPHTYAQMGITKDYLCTLKCNVFGLFTSSHLQRMEPQKERASPVVYEDRKESTQNSALKLFVCGTARQPPLEGFHLNGFPQWIPLARCSRVRPKPFHQVVYKIVETHKPAYL